MEPILVLMAPGFEEIELTAPVDILRRLDVPVVLVGVKSRRVEGSHGLVMETDMLLVDVDSGQYSGVILPGGAASVLLRDTAAVRKLIVSMHKAGKLVGAICAAPIALQAAGILENKRITCYPAPDIKGAFGSTTTVTDEAVETDGNIVTGRGPGAALEFGFALAEYLGIPTSELRRSMVV